MWIGPMCFREKAIASSFNPAVRCSAGSCWPSPESTTRGPLTLAQITQSDYHGGTYHRSLSAAVAGILASQRSIFSASRFHFPSCPALYRAGKPIKSVSSWFPFNRAWDRKILDRWISLATGRLCGQLPSFLQWDLLDARICKGTLPDPQQL